MRTSIRMFVLCSSIVVCMGGGSLFADINWASKESGIFLQGNAELNVGDDGLDAQGALGGNVTLKDANSNLVFGKNSPFSGTITLNGGTLTLSEDVVLAKGAKIVGPGTVDKQNFKLVAYPGDDTSWVANLTFLNGSGLDPSGGAQGAPGVNGTNGASQQLILGAQQDGGTITLGGGALHVFSDTPFHITANITIDGNASIVRFSGVPTSGATRVVSDAPLFVVDANKTVRLANVTLSNITQNTFNLGEGAVVELGENVTLSLIHI